MLVPESDSNDALKGHRMENYSIVVYMRIKVQCEWERQKKNFRELISERKFIGENITVWSHTK